MIRVGPLRRIDRTLLGHSLHSNARNKSEAAHELEEMLRQSTSISETAVLKAELAQVNDCPTCQDDSMPVSAPSTFHGTLQGPWSENLRLRTKESCASPLQSLN